MVVVAEDITTLLIIQLKVHGQHGTLGVLVLVHVTLMQKEIGPEVSQMVQLHAQEIQLTLEVVQVLKHSGRYQK